MVWYVMHVVEIASSVCVVVVKILPQEACRQTHSAASRA